MRLPPDHCWLCGTSATHGPLRQDTHRTPGRLCAPCWARQPSGAHPAARAASALTALLDLPAHIWRAGIRAGLAQRTALDTGITAWCDTPATIPPPAGPWDWITPETRARVNAHLRDACAATGLRLL